MTFKDLKVGDYFEYNKYILMKSKENKALNIVTVHTNNRCINIDKPNVVNIDPNCIVRKINLVVEYCTPSEE